MTISVREVRPRSVRRATLALLVVFLASCAGFDPCPVVEELGPFNTISRGDVLLSGTWTLDRINGQSLPFQSRKNPKDSLMSGTLDFYTYNVDEGTCDKPKSSSGEVIARYTAKGKSAKLQSGSFEFVNGSKRVTIRALGNAAEGNAELHASFLTPSKMTVSASNPFDFFLATGDVPTLEFHRP